MDKLKSVVSRLQDGECPECKCKLKLVSIETQFANLEKDGTVKDTESIERQYVYCNNCGYKSEAIQVGIHIIPIDRIDPYDKNWDSKYLEQNVIIWGKEGINPFKK